VEGHPRPQPLPTVLEACCLALLRLLKKPSCRTCFQVGGYCPSFYCVLCRRRWSLGRSRSIVSEEHPRQKPLPTVLGHVCLALLRLLKKPSLQNMSLQIRDPVHPSFTVCYVEGGLGRSQIDCEWGYPRTTPTNGLRACCLALLRLFRKPSLPEHVFRSGPFTRLLYCM
jgi:hypothetical protein